MINVSEESSLVDMFIFDILITYVESLSLAHDDDKVLGLFHILSFLFCLIYTLLLLSHSDRLTVVSDTVSVIFRTLCTMKWQQKQQNI